MNAKAPARLLFVGNFFGAQRRAHPYCLPLSERLERRGWAVLRTSFVANRFGRLVGMLSTAWRQRNDYDLALVDVFSGPSFLWAEAVCTALRAIGKPRIVVLRGGNLPAFAAARRRRVQRFLGRATAVVTPSRYLSTSLLSLRKDIRVIPNAIDSASYPFRLRPQVRPSLVWLRAFHAIYAPDVAVRVLALVAAEHSTARLQMIGPDKDGSMARVRQLADHRGLARMVSFIPGIAKEEVPAALSRADIFLNTTTAESFGVSPLEAAACGLVLVTTDAGELPFLWRDGEDALLVPVNDERAMADAVLRAIREPELAERLSRNARIKAESFDWSVVLPQWEALLAVTLRSPDEMR